MKRIISLMLVCSTLFSFIAMPVAAIKAEEGDKISPEMAKAYLDVINEITDKYGILAYKDEIYEIDKGLVYVDLIDFDRDGVDELLTMYIDNEQAIYQIWSYISNRAIEIHSESLSSFSLRENKYVFLATIGGKNYLVTYIDSYGLAGIDGISIHTSYTVRNSQWIEEERIEHSYLYKEGMEDDIYFMEQYKDEEFGDFYRVNRGGKNSDISKEQYNKEVNKYEEASKVGLIYLGYGGAGMIYLSEDLSENTKQIDSITDNLKDNLMSSTMKDIYSEKNREEKMAINKFLNDLRYFPFEGVFDISKPSQTVLADYMYSLLMRNYDIIESEKHVTEHKYYYEDGSYDEEIIYQRKYKEEDVNKKAIELFGTSIDFKKHLPYYYENGYIFIGEAFDPEPLTTIKINNLFSLESGLLYINIDVFESWDYENIDIISSSLYEELPSNIKENFYQMRQGHAIIKEVIKDGQKSYQLIKYNTNGEFLTEEQLNRYITKVNPEPNLSFDYSKVKDFTETKEFIDFFKNTIAELNGEKPNDKAKGEIVTYIQHSIENSSTTAVESSKNKVTIDKDIIEQALNTAGKTKLELDKILESNSITANKNIDTILRINTKGLDSNKAMSIVVDASVIEALGASKGIRVILGDNQHTVYINNEDLRSIINEIGTVSINIQKDKDTGIYTIVFMDSKGTEINQLPYPIGFSLPADNELASIFVNYKGGSDNWGGQYSSATKSIKFSTRYSGEYSILKNEINISDIGDLTEEQQKAIKFMVSKGYFGLEGDKFNGKGPLTRYDFTTALVKMFFALDRELKTTFTDIEESNQYYPYIASGQKDDIVKGFEDNTFRGQINISKEQIIALCGRTLVDKKGYIYPENPKDYLNFVDSDAIADWATVDIAIAVQNGLIDNGGLLMPQMEISRNKCVEILYKLFMLLYDVPPVAVEIDEAVEVTSESVEVKESGTSPVVIGSIIGALAIVGGGGYIFRKKNASK